MVVPLVLFMCLTATLTGTCKATSTTSREMAELGKAINLRNINLLDDFKEHEASIFEPPPSKCIVKASNSSATSYFDYYANNKDFYKKLAVQSGLSAEFQSSFSLGFTLEAAAKSTTSKISKVSGTSLIVMALKDKILVKKDCLDDDQISTLKKRFLKALEELPLTIEKPWRKNSWKPYRDFLKAYGSHVITAVDHGTCFRQMTFAESSESYSERDLQVKACASLPGPAAIASVSACANVSKSELSKASKLRTSSRIYTIGGSRETNSKLNRAMSKELIQQFMNEADDSPASIRHSLRAIWNVLQTRFSKGHPNNIRAINLEYYYLGYLNYGCRYEESGGVEIRKFDYTSQSSKIYPEYKCSIASEGCHDDSDCHYRGFWCSCRGLSCVIYKSVEQDTGEFKLTAEANSKSYKKRNGCGWKGVPFFSKCKCKNKNRSSRREVWSLPSKDAVKSPPNSDVHHQPQSLNATRNEKEKEY